MDDSEQQNALGYLGEYGVVVVPPSHENGQWFVSLAAWDDRSESYVAGTNGPLTESRDEALLQANQVLDWLAVQGPNEDMVRIWDQMQEQLGAQGLDRQWPPERGPWGNLVR